MKSKLVHVAFVSICTYFGFCVFLDIPFVVVALIFLWENIESVNR